MLTVNFGSNYRCPQFCCFTSSDKLPSPFRHLPIACVSPAHLGFAHICSVTGSQQGLSRQKARQQFRNTSTSHHHFMLSFDGLNILVFSLFLSFSREKGIVVPHCEITCSWFYCAVQICLHNSLKKSFITAHQGSLLICF